MSWMAIDFVLAVEHQLRNVVAAAASHGIVAESVSLHCRDVLPLTHINVVGLSDCPLAGRAQERLQANKASSTADEKGLAAVYDIRLLSPAQKIVLSTCCMLVCCEILQLLSSDSGLKGDLVNISCQAGISYCILPVDGQIR